MKLKFLVALCLLRDEFRWTAGVMLVDFLRETKLATLQPMSVKHGNRYTNNNTHHFHSQQELHGFFFSDTV